MALRFLILLVLGATLIGIGVLAYYGNRVDYVPVASEIEPQSAMELGDRLQARGIPFKFNDDQTILYVPREQYSQARAEIATESAHTGGPKGFELFDETPLGSTPFTQHVNYQRALQNELARSIAQIDGVSSARVHIVRSEPTPFLRDQKPTTASVVVKLKQGAILTKGIAGGIVSIVSRAVEGLTQDNVTLMDQHGRVLSGHTSDDLGHSSGQLEAQNAVEQHLSTKAESMLEKVLGKGKAIVRVSTALNFQKFREKRESYEPESRVILSERVTATKNQSGGSTPKGMPGYASNLPNQLTTMALRYPNSNNSQNQEETNQTEYGVSKRIQELEEKPGALERMTIAVLVDLEAIGKDGMGIEEIREIIKQAVGFRADRDEIRVTSVKLPKTSLTGGEWPALKSAEKKEAKEPVKLEPESSVIFDAQTLDTAQQWLAHIRLGAIITLGVLTVAILIWMILAPSAYDAEKTPLSQAATERMRDLSSRNPEEVAKSMTVFLSQ